MPFCSSCGQEVSPQAAFCPNCGTRIASPGAPSAAPPPSSPGSSSPPPPPYRTQDTEFDRLTRNSQTQEHWLRRVAAYIIDSIIIFIVVAIIGFAIGFGFLFFSFFFGFSAGLWALFTLLYFGILEGMRQRTIGKGLMGLTVVTTDGSRVDYAKAFLRNLSKVYWLLLLLDLIAGFLMHDVAPGQKFSDHIAKTNVIIYQR
jgi:hypothetical protein